MYAVEAVLRSYAKIYKEDEEKWGVTGLLHDVDWEKYPKTHPKEIVKNLTEIGTDKEIIHAIASHGNNSPEYPTNHFEERTSLLDKALFASDEIAGFVIACALVRPDKLDTLKAKSVKKKLKDKAFAAKVSREEIYQGVKELGVDLDEHIQLVIEALQGIKEELGL